LLFCNPIPLSRAKIARSMHNSNQIKHKPVKSQNRLDWFGKP